MHQTATVEQVRQVLRHQLDWLWASPQQARHVAPVMVWGAPGVGKSTAIRELCEELEIGFIDVRLAQREPVDIRGLPVPRGDEVRWLLSSEWPRDPASRGIILFDELTAADRTLQVAAYEFILDRRLGDLYQVPPGWLICAAGNRSEDRAVAMTMSSALANRFCHLELQPDLAGWIRWALARGLHPEVVAFLRFMPQRFFSMEGNLERGWPSPRSWERVALTLRQGDGLDPDLLALMIQGLVGRGAAAEFLAFRRWSVQLPDVPALLSGAAAFTVPERADQRFALCTALVHHLLRASGSEWPAWLAQFLKIGLQFGSDFAVMAMVDLLQQLEARDDTDRLADLFGQALFTTWSQRHGTVLAAQRPLTQAGGGATRRAEGRREPGPLTRAATAARAA